MKTNLANIFVVCLLFIPSIAFSEEGALLDTDSNLEWETQGSSHFIWDDAIKYCKDLKLNNNIDWRLPNMKELLTLVDYRGGYDSSSDSQVHIKSDFISSTVLDNTYWSSTANYISQELIFALDYNVNGYTFKGFFREQTEKAPATRCVRNYN